MIDKAINIQRKKLYIKTFGCEMNIYDSKRMSDLMYVHGFDLQDELTDADMIILNTCHIRGKASEKTYSELGRIRKLKDDKEDMVIVVAGCTAQAEGEEIIKRAPYVDIVVGPQSYYNLPELVERVKRTKGWVCELEFNAEKKFDVIKEDRYDGLYKAFVTVQEGCDKFCRFCCVPYTRGAEYSRNVPEIYREVVRKASQGVKELTLLGQNVTAYHGLCDNREWGLGKLIKHVASVSDIERIKYMTSHPKDMIDDELFAAHANEVKLMPYIHLPVQSGSDHVLRLMNRKHDRDFYFKVIDRFREARPDIAFASDFIVGYPGETDKDFMQTLDLVERVEYASAYSFKYSKRPGTVAASIKEQVDEHVKDERLQELQKLIKAKQMKFNLNAVGRKLQVLVEKEGRHKGQVVGKSQYMQTVVVTGGSELIGKFVDVLVTESGLNSLKGVAATTS